MPEEVSETIPEITPPTSTAEPAIDPSIMQGLGIKREDIEGFWDRRHSVLTEAFENGSKAYELFKTPNASVDFLKLGEHITIKMDAPAHSPEDLLQQAAELFQRGEHQAHGELIGSYIQALGLGALKDKRYEFTAKAFNVFVDGKLDQSTSLLNMLGEKIRLTFPQEKEAQDELVKLGYAIQNTKKTSQSSAPSPSSVSGNEGILRPATPPPPGSPFGRQN